MELKDIITNREMKKGKLSSDLIFKEVKLFDRHQRLVLVLDKTSGKVEYYYKNNKDGVVAYDNDRGFVVNTCEDCGDTFVTKKVPEIKKCPSCLVDDQLKDLDKLLDKIIADMGKKCDKPTQPVGELAKPDEKPNEKPNEKPKQVHRGYERKNTYITRYLDTLDEVYDVADREDRKKYYTNKNKIISDDTMIAIINMLYRDEDLDAIAKKFNLKLESAYRYCYVLSKMGITYRYIDKKGESQYKLYDNLNIVKVR